MKTANEVFSHLEIMSRRFDEMKHRLCFLKADNRLTEYEKIAKAVIVLLEMRADLISNSDDLFKWISDHKKGAKNDAMVGTTEKQAVAVSDPDVSGD